MQLDKYDGCSQELCSDTSSSISRSSTWSSISTLSSVASSISDDFRASRDDVPHEQHHGHARAPWHITSQYYKCASHQPDGASNATADPQSYASAALEPHKKRQNPRRSSTSAKHYHPPTLQRQCERKSSFVNNLVGCAAEMVQVIWPLSSACHGDGGYSRSLLPLRNYIEETLRRSRTSYSTLQVALYYLVLIKPFVPSVDFTQAQTSDCPALRALMCGRRMFLAALILASKYLQDRNYSAKAWSKMSGLRVEEVNGNERMFLKKVNWKLHIPEVTFQKWAQVVLKYTPEQSPPSDGSSAMTWRSIVPLLTADLDTVSSQQPLKLSDRADTTLLDLTDATVVSPCSVSRPTPEAMAQNGLTTSNRLCALNRRLTELKTDAPLPPTPGLVRMGPLPTPYLTPTANSLSIPAVNVNASGAPAAPPAHSAMNPIITFGANRRPIDHRTLSFSSGGESSYPASRRTSFGSLRSSPESMISDRSRSSCASNGSSVPAMPLRSLTLAPDRAQARQATRHDAELLVLPRKSAPEEHDECFARRPIDTVTDEATVTTSPDGITFNNDERTSVYAIKPGKTDGYVKPELRLEKSRKRARAQTGNRRSELHEELHEEVRFMLQDAENEGVRLDVDDELSLTPSAAANLTSRLLAHASSVPSIKAAQPPPSLSRQSSGRIPIQKNAKRSCCTTATTAGSPTHH